MSITHSCWLSRPHVWKEQVTFTPLLFLDICRYIIYMSIFVCIHHATFVYYFLGIHAHYVKRQEISWFQVCWCFATAATPPCVSVQSSIMTEATGIWLSNSASCKYLQKNWWRTVHQAPVVKSVWTSENRADAELTDSSMCGHCVHANKFENIDMQ